MVTVYRALQASRADLRVAKLEDFGARQDGGTLDAHVDEQVKQSAAEMGRQNK